MYRGSGVRIRADGCRGLTRCVFFPREVRGVLFLFLEGREGLHGVKESESSGII